jgi:hypothetical protein
VVISHRGPAGAEQLMLFPEARHARRLSHVFEGPRTAVRPRLDLVAESWQRLSTIAATATTRIGERVIGDRRAVGFEAPLTALLEPRETVAHGRVRVWAAADTATPLDIELSLTGVDGGVTRTTMSDIEWDVHLDPELFDLTPPDGWSVSHIRRRVITFESARLAPQVRVTIGPEAGPVLATEDDIAAVRSLEQVVDESPGGAPPTTRLEVELEENAAARLTDFAERNPEEILIVDVNHEVRVAMPAAAAGNTTVHLDLSRLERDPEWILSSLIVSGDG